MTEQLLSKTPKCLEHELAVANAEVERLKEQLDFALNPIHTCHDKCERPACVFRRQRDALLANSKALAECMKGHLSVTLYDEPRKALAAHNKLMEQLSPTAAGSGMGG